MPVLVWHAVSSAGPARCHQAACLIDDTLYVHGGLPSSLSSARPSNSLHSYKFALDEWTDLTSPRSPFLSHHTAVPYKKTHVLLIGGWNGKRRTSNIHAYDTVEKSWHETKRLEDFPPGAGLSSHTSTRLAAAAILVTGREGGLRTQRRSGGAFVVSERRRRFFYDDHSTSSTASRSGHTATPVGRDRVVLYGGRADNPIEYRTRVFVVAEYDAVDVANFFEFFVKLRKDPGCRKYHVAVPGSSPDGIFVHGGETFDGRVKGATSDLIYIDFSGVGITWYAVNVDEAVRRAGHVGFVRKGAFYIFGGYDGSGKSCSDLLQLDCKRDKINETPQSNT